MYYAVYGYTGHDEITGRWTGKAAWLRQWVMPSAGEAVWRAMQFAKEADKGTMRFDVVSVENGKPTVVASYGKVGKKPKPDCDPCKFWVRWFDAPPSEGWFQWRNACDPEFVAQYDAEWDHTIHADCADEDRQGR